MINDGYKSAVVALPDTILYETTRRLIDCGFERILLEKPGCQKSKEYL